MATKYTGLTAEHRLVRGEYLRILVAHPPLSFLHPLVEQMPRIYDRLYADAWVVPVNFNATVAGDTAATVDVRVLATGDGKTVAQLIERIHGSVSGIFGVGQFAEVVEVRAIAGKDAGMAHGPEQRADATRDADKAAGQLPPLPQLRAVSHTVIAAAVLAAFVVLWPYLQPSRRT